MAKDPAAVALGRKGGKARLKTMTAEERRRIAKKAVEARWAKEREESKALKQRASELLSRTQARSPRSKPKKGNS